MPIVSYAQNLEDVLLWRALQHVAGGVYLDIGAQDPIFDSVSKGFYELGWRGIHVEPTAQYVELLLRDRPDERVVHAAVSNRPGMLKFYEIPDTGMSTASEAIAANVAKLGWKVVETLVAAVTLDQVFSNITDKEIHWLKIDVEGLERQVLEGWRKSEHRPWIVVIEAIHPLTHAQTHREWEHLLLAKNYSFVHFDGLNRYYLSAVHKDFKKHFQYGPCLWDEFILPEMSRPARVLMQRSKEALARVRADSDAAAARRDEAIFQSNAKVVELDGALGGARATVDQTRRQLDQAREELDRARGELARTLEVLNKTRVELVHARGKLDRMQDALDGTRAELDLARTSSDLLRDELDQGRGALSETRAELAERSSALDQTREDLNRAKGALDRSRAELDQDRGALDKTRQELVCTRAALAQADQELDHTRAELAQTHQALDYTRAELAQTDGALHHTQADLTETRGSLGLTRDDLVQTRADLDHTRADLAHALTELAQTRGALDRMQDEVGQTRSELDLTRGALEQTIVETRQSIEGWSRERAHLIVALEGITGSLWWRLSVPFRKRFALPAAMSAGIKSNRDSDQSGVCPPIAGTRADLPSQSCPTTPAGKSHIASSIEELLSLHGEPFVRCAYATLLHRDPDPDGLRHFLTRIRNGDSPSAIIADIHLSAEGQQQRGILSGLHRAIRCYRWQRLPLLWQIFRWTGVCRDRLDVRRALTRIAARLDQLAPLTPSSGAVGSKVCVACSVEELLALHDESFVRCAYATILGRDPDPDGLAHFLTCIRNGDSRRAILAAIRFSPEGQERPTTLTGLDQAIRCYRWQRLLLLGSILRLAKPCHQGLDVKRELAVIGARLDLLVRATLSPGENSQRPLVASSIEELLSLHDESFIRCTYATVLCRDPDPDGFRHFLARIRSGESRRAVLASIRLSAEGQRQASVLPGLDQAIGCYRWQRRPVIGAILRLVRVCHERFDLRRELENIEGRMDLLLRLSSPSALAPQVDERQFPKVIPPPSPASNLTEPVPTLTAGRSAKPPGAVVWSPLAWRIEGVSDEPGDLSLISVELTRAFADLSHEVPLAASNDRPRVTSLVLAPPPPNDAPAGSTILLWQDWKESGYPVDWIDLFNATVSGVACATDHTLKVLLDHGLSASVAAVGVGVDHWDRILPSSDYIAPGKSFRFLHVSPCTVSDGIDLLLESFGRVFDCEDNVSLIIKPTSTPSDALFTSLIQQRDGNPGFPDVVLLEGNLADPELRALYRQCHVFVAPTRAGGFALPIAHALLSGLPVVTTAWGGHREYSDELNSWLVDYCFQRAGTATDLPASLWAEPVAASLDHTFALAYRATPSERFAMASSGRKRLLERFTWKDVALRLAALAVSATPEATPARKRLRLGWVTTWNVKCGIASHVEHLVSSLPTEDTVVFAAKQEPRIRPDGPNCLRTWTPGKESNDLEEIARQLGLYSVDALVIQHNYGFYNHRELNDFIESILAKGIIVLVELHSTVEPPGASENFRLTGFLSALRKCHRILAHSPTDINRLKALGLVNNVMLFPLGVITHRRGLPAAEKTSTSPLIASFGFCLPNKGFPELVEAASLLRREGRPVRLLMLTAEYPAPASSQEIKRIKELIEERGLEEYVEMHTEFLEWEACMLLLSKADLLVNPYQRTGESASASVRYALASCRPVAVTPLSFFDDLGDAVFRMPGTSFNDIAEGIDSALTHLREGSDIARRVEAAARRWLGAHAYSRQAASLMQTARALAREELTENETRGELIGTTAAASRTPRGLPRGVFINTAKESCSIYESGRMVYNCIKESEHYTLDYFSLDMFDVSLLATEGRIRSLDAAKADSSAGEAVPYDFWVFNWHFLTMAPRLDLPSIGRLPGLKFTVVLELESDSPLSLIPSDVFDGYIALDPTTPAVGKIFPFPRPLEGDPRRPGFCRDVPVIGSFGFGTPGKGFELLVEAVNREFDRAVVRVNIPKGTYTASFDAIHGRDYYNYIASQCQRIAKPGIDVRFTNDFMPPDELVNWCADNDLNCFLYTRRQPGLSATTDQAIMSGRPLLTGSNDTFRHIHRYIPAYPLTSLRQAIDTTAPLVRRMQQDWSRKSFGHTFHRMLATLELITFDRSDERAAILNAPRATVLIMSRPRSNPSDIAWYATRVADCISRSGEYSVLRARWTDLAELKEQVTNLQPSAVIVLDFPGVKWEALTAALKTVAGPKIVLMDDERCSGRSSDGLFMLPRRPVVPYFTSVAALRTRSPSIWLVGFSADGSNLEEVVAKIAREVTEAELLLEVPANGNSVFARRTSRLRQQLPQAGGLRLSSHCLPSEGVSIIANFATSHLVVFYNDPARSEELERLTSLAMTTERPIAFTHAAPFRYFLNGATYIEDLGTADIISLGMAAQISLYYDFGEWQLYADIHRLLSVEPVPIDVGPQEVAS